MSSEVAIIQAGSATAATRFWKAGPAARTAARRSSGLPPGSAARQSRSASALCAATLMPWA